METLFKKEKNDLNLIYDNHNKKDVLWWKDFRSINGGFECMYEGKWSIETNNKYQGNKIKNKRWFKRWWKSVKINNENIELEKHSKPNLGNYSYLSKSMGCNKKCSSFKGGNFSSNKNRCDNLSKYDLFNVEVVKCSILKGINFRISNVFFKDRPCKGCIIQASCNSGCDKLDDYNDNLKLRGKVTGYNPASKVGLVGVSPYSDAIFGKIN